MRKESWWLALLFIALLGAMAATPLLEQPPTLRAQAQSGEFNAPRAKARLASILGDQRAHPADTEADDRVRSYLVAQLRQLGLTPIVRDQFACNELYKQRGVSCARVGNVIAILGPTSGRALLLNAHYDSTPVGPGAADDGIGVATLLEVATNLKGRPLKRPVILLFNEGEELGLVGARAFLADPLSRNVDSLINLEARGVSGPVNMFETSRPNSAPIRIFAEAVRYPVANSLSTDVYRLLPNYTDVNSFAERSWLKLNLAPIGNETRYHSSGDDVEHLHPATLQHMGDQTLSLTLALANGTAKATDSDHIFMDFVGRGLITLPLSLGVVLLVSLLLAFAVISLRRGELLRSAVAILAAIVLSGLLSWLILTVIGAVRHGMFWRAHPIWTHLAVYSSTLLAAAVLLITVGASLDRTRLRAAFWLIFLGVGAAIGPIAPGAIIFFLFPPLLVLIGVVAKRRWKRAEQAGALAAILLLYLTWGAMLGLLQELLNGGPIWVFAPLGALLIIPCAIEARPLMIGAGLHTAALLGGVLVLALSAASAAVPAYSADRQQRFVIQHVTDASTHKSWWSVLNDGAPLPYAGKRNRGALPFSDRPRWIWDAPPDPAAKAPAVKLLSHVRTGNERALTLRLSLNGSEQIALVAPADSRIRSAGIGHFMRPIDQNQEGKYFISCFGRSCEGATLQLTTGQLQPIRFLVLGSKAPLPPSAAPLLAGRPPFARPQYDRDESIVFTRVNL
jgi:hypothetical protein